MSLIENLGKKLEHLPDIIMDYTASLDGVKNNLRIEGKNLERANVEHASWMSFYDQKRIELRTLCRYLEVQVENVRGKLWKSYTEKHTRELGPKDKEQYINNEKEYLDLQELFLEVEELYKKYEAVVEAYKSRGFALRNITELRVHSLQDTEL